MFVGAIPSDVRTFMANVAPAFAGRCVVVGCSGNFSMEAVLSTAAQPAQIHSNDVSLYSCLLGAYVTGTPLPLTVASPLVDWLAPYLEDPARALAAIMVLLDMLPYRKRTTRHAQRLWDEYRHAFEGLVTQTLAKLARVTLRVTSFTAGDVWDHFRRFADTPNAVFCCFAPTYSGGYERLYKPLEALVTWEPPSYTLLDAARRDALLDWLSPRPFLWYDDRVLPGRTPVMYLQRGRMRTVYLYASAVHRTAVLKPRPRGPLPRWRLADAQTVLAPATQVTCVPCLPAEVLKYKEAFLGKHIAFSAGDWAFAVLATPPGAIGGFFEFRPGRFGQRELYLLADFAVPGTVYQRLSKLIVMLAAAGETRAALERRLIRRIPSLYTTAFTARPVSMKYRGVLTLKNRGRTPEGEPFLNYAGPFTALSWQETYAQWLTIHGSKTSSSASTPPSPA